VRAQAKPNEQQEHGAVAPTADGTVLIGRQQLLELMWRQTSRECGVPPMGWLGCYGLQAGSDLAAEEHKPQQ
jgi:hypothetical protein